MEKTNYVYYNYLMRFVEKSRKEKRSGVNYSLNMLEVADKAIEKYVKEYLNKDDINGKAIINGILRDHIFNYTSYANTIEDLEENKSKDSKFKDIPPNKIKKQANSKKSTDDVLNMSLSEIYKAIVDLQKDSDDDEKFLQILKLLYTIYDNPDIDNLSKLKAAKRLDFICTHLGYYSTKILYDTIKERNESNEKGE